MTSLRSLAFLPLLAGLAFSQVSDTEALLAAATSRDTDTVRTLLDKGVDPNAGDANGRTALLLAIEGFASEYKIVGTSDEIARLLIAQGARVNGQDNDGWSPLLRLMSN